MNSIDKARQATYHGKTKMGAVRIMVDGERMLGTGHVFILEQVINASGKKSQKRVLYHCTPDHPSELNESKSIKCKGHKTGKDYIFVGTLSQVKKHKRVLAKLPEALENVPTIGAVYASNTGSPKRPSKITKFKQSNKVLIEMEVIAAMAKTGLDPDLKLSHVCVLIHESRATIYRKIKLCQFPAPIKRGRGSFWPLSEILKYKSKI